MRIAIGLLTASAVLAAAAQGEGLLTGGNVVIQVEAAQRAIAQQALRLPASDLATTAERLGDMADGVRKAVGKEAGKRIDRIDDDDEGRALRAQAAALLSQGWIAASEGCTDGDATAMASALSTAVEALAAAKNSSKSAQPAIHGVLAADGRPLFAVHADARDVKLALSGTNLHDAACDDPRLIATDPAANPLAAQPTITALAPTRIGISLPPGLSPGPYLLRLRPMKKGRFLGCSAQPEAVVALTIVAAPKWRVRYSLTPTCRVKSGKQYVETAQAVVSGALPDLGAYGASVSAAVELPACADPVSYAVSATAEYADGSDASIGPITQSAAAGITAGFPGGVSLRWDPQVRQLFATASAQRCKGFF